MKRPGRSSAARTFERVPHGSWPLSYQADAADLGEVGLGEIVRATITRWLAADSTDVALNTTGEAVWFDDTRTRAPTTERLSRADLAHLLKVGWGAYDRGPRGLWPTATLSEVSERPFGPWTLASYRRRLSSDGPHPFREDALVTQLVERGQLSATWYIQVLATDSEGNALILDQYTGK